MIMWLGAAPFAHAYIDGGTATMVFQALAAAAFASLFFIKTIWFRAKAFFSSLFPKK